MKVDEIKTIIVLEGINGCGKSTIAFNSEFHKRLTSNDKYSNILGFKGVSVFRCPGDGIPEVRNLIKEKDYTFNEYTCMNLSLADMNELVIEGIRPALKNHRIVILDRCFHSTFVYQNFHINGIKSSDIITNNVMNIFGKDLLDKMITFILDIPYEVSKQRRDFVGTIDRFEEEFDEDSSSKIFFNEKRFLYLNLLTPSKTAKKVLKDVFVLDGTVDINQNISNILSYLDIVNSPRSI